MKICPRCNLPLSDEKFRRLSNGRLYCYCRECVRAYRKAYKRSDKWKRANARYERSAKGRAVKARFRKKYRGTVTPQKRRAWALLTQAVAAGRLVRPVFCEDCGKPCVPHGHHPDYTQPLFVIWVCQECHNIRHGLVRQD